MVANPFYRPPTQYQLDSELEKAIKAGDSKAVSQALARGADISASRSAAMGKTPLMLALEIQSDHILTQLLAYKDKKPDLSRTDEFGETALHHALKRTGTSFAGFLINAGAPVTIADKKGRTPMHIAAMSGSNDRIKALVDKGADIHALTNAGETPIMLAAHNWKWSTLKDLLDNGASVEIKDYKGRTPLHYIAAYAEHYSELVEVMIKAGCDAGLPDKEGNTPLTLAADRGYHKTIAALLKHAPALDVNTVNPNGETPLAVVVRGKHWQAAEELVRKGANPDEKDDACMTPLMFAAADGQEHLVAVLIENKADVLHVANSGAQAADIARWAGHEKIRDMIEEAGRVQLDSLADAFRAGTTARSAPTIKRLTLTPRSPAVI